MTKVRLYEIRGVPKGLIHSDILATSGFLVYNSEPDF